MFQEDYSLNIKLNEELAAKYREIQNKYIVLKNQALDKYNQCLTQEQHLKDLKQVSIFQDLTVEQGFDNILKNCNLFSHLDLMAGC